MSTDIEPGPDPNEVRRHAKKMLTELEYRRKYRRYDFYRPHPKQLEAHNIIATEFMLRAGNQLGKTTWGAMQLTFDSLAMYPSWYKGRRHSIVPIERQHEFIGWIGGPTSIMVRDNPQLKLFGDVSQKDGLGTGAVPLDNILSTTSARGISNFIDTVTLRRETGGTAVIRQKTYEMDRQAWQGEPVDVCWLDELDKDDVIYGEVLARLTATRGRVFITATPRPGRVAIRRRFIERAGPDMAELLMGLDDALHIPKSDHARILATYNDRERATRAYGADYQGGGGVFAIPEEDIKHSRALSDIPSYWRFLWAFDLAHGGMSTSAHPWAAVLGAWDMDNDVIYVLEALRMKQALSPMHVTRVMQNPYWAAPVAWPHDGTQGDFATGLTFAATYKKLGLNMRPQHATFKDGGYALMAGIAEMEQRFATGRLKVARWLTEWFEEYRDYHYGDDGRIVKADDDLMSATRVLCMDIRFAKAMSASGSRGQFSGDGPKHPWHEPMRDQREDYDAAFWCDYHGR